MAETRMIEFIQEPGETLSGFARRISTAYCARPDEYFTQMTWNVDRREVMFSSPLSSRETIHITTEGRTSELEICSLINVIAGGRFGYAAWLKDMSKRQRIVIVDNSSGTPELQKGAHFGR